MNDVGDEACNDADDEAFNDAAGENFMDGNAFNQHPVNDYMNDDGGDINEGLFDFMDVDVLFMFHHFSANIPNHKDAIPKLFL